jgi:hypothetical protein
MRRTDHLLKTLSAVRRCLDECLHDANPLVALDKCLRELRLNPEWTDAEIEEVEATARKAIESAALNKQMADGRRSTTMLGV